MQPNTMFYQADQEIQSTQCLGETAKTVLIISSTTTLSTNTNKTTTTEKIRNEANKEFYDFKAIKKTITSTLNILQQ